jgi:hypothetical protein
MMKSQSSVYSWCGCRDRRRGGGWAAGARAAGGRVTAAGMSAWSCPPGRAETAAGSGAAGSPTAPPSRRRWQRW